MAGTASRNVVIAPSAPFDYGFATEREDAGLRQLLRETPMPGPIRVSFEREPSFFAACRADAERHYAIYARDRRTGKLFAMACRSVRRCFVNGRPRYLGTLSQLRIAPGYRHMTRRLLRWGFQLLSETHAADEAPFDMTTIVDGNETARRLLEAGLPGLPRYTPLGRVFTFLLPVRRRGFRSASARSETRSPEVPRGFEPPQFAPVWSERERERFHSVPGGLALWDRRSEKQTVVQGYGPWLGCGRRLLRLPAPGSVLPMVYLAAVGPLDMASLDAALDAARRMDCRWLAIGLPEHHRLVPGIRRRYRPQVYESLLYVVHEPGVDVDLDGRMPHLEVSLL